MTQPEADLIESQRILDGTHCLCGGYDAEIYYEPGACWIECLECKRSVAAPDFELNQCLRLWAGDSK
jgi:hypothetical protein